MGQNDTIIPIEKPVRKYYKHISGLKGFACFGVMVGHFLGLYKYAEAFIPRIALLDAVLNSPLDFLLNEGFWLELFFVVSGYLLAKSSIKTVSDLLIKSISRFFRLALPILFAGVVIYTVGRFIGFHNEETKALFQCDWYQKYYASPISVKEALLSPYYVLFCGQANLNPPYWVLRHMFIASLLVYGFKYLHGKLGAKIPAVSFSCMALAALFTLYKYPIIGACLSGMLISFCEDNPAYCSRSFFAFWAMLLPVAFYLLPRHMISVVIFGVMIVFIPRLPWLDRLFSSGLFQFFGKISWGVYSFHWPLMCSIGAVFLLAFFPRFGNLGGYLLSCILTSAIVVILSVAFYYTLEKLASGIVRTITSAMKKALSLRQVRSAE